MKAAERSMTDYKIDFESIPWHSPLEGMRARACESDGRQLRVVEYAKEMAPHWCDKGHIGYILEGRFEIRFGNGQVDTFEPGDGVFIPSGPDHKHMGKALTDVVRVVFVEDT